LYIPQKRKVALKVIRELIEFEPKEQETDLAQAKKFLSRNQKKESNSICYF
jgi:hypothetical protein